mmetsp:Transcript_45574/g.143128  ORF Transcript_45574/g.143128 Transcript_45574/m.143128 type:complete len:211 (+) Transcript_45574:701-1333(+)
MKVFHGTLRLSSRSGTRSRLGFLYVRSVALHLLADSNVLQRLRCNSGLPAPSTVRSGQWTATASFKHSETCSFMLCIVLDFIQIHMASFKFAQHDNGTGASGQIRCRGVGRVSRQRLPEREQPVARSRRPGGEDVTAQCAGPPNGNQRLLNWHEPHCRSSDSSESLGPPMIQDSQSRSPILNRRTWKPPPQPGSAPGGSCSEPAGWRGLG